MKKQSAGILPYRLKDGQPEFFIVHPGGPFFKKKDNGFWSIAKGELDADEPPLTAAKREFLEETGIKISGKFIELKPQKLKSGKLIHAWAVEAGFDTDNIQSNSFEIEWPPKSGKMTTFPEIDKFGWFDTKTTLAKLNEAQGAFVYEILSQLGIQH
jgi:predicted NUDIX family NTP pyrophosphohydrolase